MQRYMDRIMRRVSADDQTQGPYVKLPFFDTFLPLQEANELKEEPDMLHIVVNDTGVTPLPKDKSKAHYFVHKSQVIVRLLSRLEK